MAPSCLKILKCDHAYATYLDARQRFQQLKLSRGYLPIVALTDGQANASAASGSSSPSKGNGKNKGKGKSISKGKGSLRWLHCTSSCFEHVLPAWTLEPQRCAARSPDRSGSWSAEG